ncbi:MAG: 16S rRNA (guanine(966)-N(2))-methyltransferase RsmD [Pyrinomonadaceae bacterium]
MRIIAGQYRGRILKSPSSLHTRPTSDRLRETLFNIIAPRIVEARFLDLCAGTGAIGIEALSRGAKHVTFIDRSRKMCGLIEANLDMLEVPEDETEVVLSDATEFMRRLMRNESNQREVWNMIFYDPPYADNYAPVLETFGAATDKLLAGDGIFITEHHHKNILKDEYGALRRWRIVKQGDSSLSFYER